MKLKSKEVDLDGDVFVVAEIAVGQMMPLMSKLNSEDEVEAQEAQLDMMRVCILVDGEPIGDRLDELGISAYLKLAEDVMAINGMDLVGKD